MKKKSLAIALLAGTVLAGTALATTQGRASDHDDGTTPLKVQNTNLTELYAFTEKSQNASASGDDMILIMTYNPRSVGGQQYFSNTGARYEIHASRVSSNTAAPDPKDDVVLRFEFGEPDANKQQAMTVTAIRDGQPVSASATTGGQRILTTPIGQKPVNNAVRLGDAEITVFNGLREDPFFFDVEQFFRVRASAAEIAQGKAEKSSQVTFRNPGVDFTIGFNVISTVVRVPRAFLQGPNSQATTFDLWETISVRK